MAKSVVYNFFQIVYVYWFFHFSLSYGSDLHKGNDFFVKWTHFLELLTKMTLF
jgi:hypothetical protein